MLGGSVVVHRTRRYTAFAAVGARFIQVAESKETSLTWTLAFFLPPYKPQGTQAPQTAVK